MANRIRSASEKARLVDAWRQSGLPLTSFARNNGVPPTSLAKWVAAAGKQTSFVPVHIVAPAPSPGHLVVELAGSGHRVHVPSDFDPVLLRRLAEALC